MHYFTFAEKDSTLYQASGSLNSGMDEILEVRKDVSDSGETVNSSRIVIKFNLYIGESNMKWDTPAYEDIRFGFEVTMYINNK